MVARVAYDGRGDGGGEYAGGSRIPQGVNEGADEVWQKGPGIIRYSCWS